MQLTSATVSTLLDPMRGLAMLDLRARGDDRSWLLYDPSRGTDSVCLGAPYDDVWRGTFEELFPNDAPEIFEGRELADHGELWSSPMEILERTPLALHGRLECRTVPAVVEKTVALDDEVPVVRMEYRVTNCGDAPIPFLFKLHAAMAVEPGDTVLLPGGVVEAVEPGFGRLASCERRPWPVAVDERGAPLDLSRVRDPSEGFREFVYVHDLPEGWCGIRRGGSGQQFRLQYPRQIFPYCWLFITYGGWRGYHTIVLEPCTNYPKSLAQAAARGSCASVAPGASWEARAEIRLGTGGAS